MPVIWIIILIVALFLEAITTALVSIWFALGAVGAMIASVLECSETVQLIVFVVVTAISLIFTKSIIKKLTADGYTPTNGELDIGAMAVVIQDIDSSKFAGRIRLNGVDWPAVDVNNGIIKVGQMVVIKRRECNIMYVSVPSEENESSE